MLSSLVKQLTYLSPIATVDADAKRAVVSEITQLKVEVGAHDEEIERSKQEGRKIEEEAKEIDKRGVCVNVFRSQF